MNNGHCPLFIATLVQTTELPYYTLLTPEIQFLATYSLANCPLFIATPVQTTGLCPLAYYTLPYVDSRNSISSDIFSRKLNQQI